MLGSEWEEAEGEQFAAIRWQARAPGTTRIGLAVGGRGRGRWSA